MLQTLGQNQQNTAKSKEIYPIAIPGPKKRGCGTYTNMHAGASHIQIKTEKLASAGDFIKHLYTIRRNSEQGK